MWVYQDQGGNHIISDEEILASYYPWWQEQMRKVGKEHLISEASCIEDFVVVHWAYKQTEEPTGLSRRSCSKLELES